MFVKGMKEVYLIKENKAWTNFTKLILVVFFVRYIFSQWFLIFNFFGNKKKNDHARTLDLSTFYKTAFSLQLEVLQGFTV